MDALKINRKTFGKDIIAGLTAAIAGIPDGMASATLAGVNPVFGLYNLMVGTPIAAIFTSSVYMAVINASAMALVAYDALAAYSGEEQVKALDDEALKAKTVEFKTKLQDGAQPEDILVEAFAVVREAARRNVETVRRRGVWRSPDGDESAVAAHRYPGGRRRPEHRPQLPADPALGRGRGGGIHARLRARAVPRVCRRGAGFGFAGAVQGSVAGCTRVRRGDPGLRLPLAQHHRL